MKLLILVLLSISINQSDSPLSSLKWKKRIVIIHHQEDLFQTFIKQADDLNDRDMIIINIGNDNLKTYPQTLDLNPKSITDYYGLENKNSRVVLIGKDGGIKLNKSSASNNEIYSLIDGMPMRQAEMRKKSGY